MYRQRVQCAVRVLSLAAFLVSSGFSANLNVLWFTAATTDGGGSFSSYEAGVRHLAAYTESNSMDDDWNVTFWNPESSFTAGSLNSYNVLVVASPQFIDGADYSALNANLPAFGSRIVVTGLDADWHYMNTPGYASFDGPRGFLLDTINWAGKGTGLGAVFLAPQGNVPLNFTGLGNEAPYENLDNVEIDPAAASHPAQLGLSSAGLSNWATSGKEAWDGFDVSRWAALQVNGDDRSTALTLASISASEVPADPTPEPSTAMLLIGVTGCLAILRRLK